MTLRLLATFGGCLGLMAAGSAGAQDRPGAPDSSSAVEDVIVTGSLIRRPGAAMPSETIDRSTIETAGTLEPSGLLRLVAANSGSEAQIDQLNQPQSSGTAQFNLRNLGLGSTLVLLNGRRQTFSAVTATDGSGFVDINALVPLIAIERLDVLKDGASAIYGSDAVAGVVNFITRSNVDRTEMRARAALVDGSEESTLEAIGSAEVLGGSLVLAGSIFHRSALGSDERDFTQAETYGLAPWTAVTSYGQPGSYFRPSRQGFAPDPDCDNQAFASAYRNGPTDAFCRLDYSDFFDLAPEEDRVQAFTRWKKPLTDTVTFSLEAAGAWTRTWARQSPSLPILARSLTVPADHPDNPFGEALLFRGRLLGAEAGASRALFEYKTGQVVASLDGRWANGWRWTVDSTFSRQTVFYDKPDTIGSALQNALNGMGGPDCDPRTGAAGVGPCRYFNPFGSARLGTGTPNDDAMVNSLIGYTGLKGSSSLWTLDALARGEAVRWGGGVLDLAVGAQRRRSAQSQDWSELVNAGDLLTAGQSPDFDGDQSATAVFAEAGLRLGQTFEAQIAARYETEAGVDRVSPKVAVAWTPGEAFTLRASYTEGFRSPSLFVRRGAQASQPSVFDRGAFVFVNTVTYGNPGLDPEISRSGTVGAVWSPVQGLRLSVDAWRFNYENLVVKESAQALIDQARLDDAAGLSDSDAQTRVRRDTSGALSFVALNFINAASVKAQGLDWAIRYEGDLGGGRVGASAVWTHVDRHDIRLTANGPVTSGVGSTNLNTLARSLPRDRGEFAVTWDRGSWSLGALAHYTSGYTNDRAGITDASIGSLVTFDMNLARSIGNGLRASLGVVNIADRDPPLAQFALGYDPGVADPRGRMLVLGLTRTF